VDLFDQSLSLWGKKLAVIGLNSAKYEMINGKKNGGYLLNEFDGAFLQNFSPQKSFFVYLLEKQSKYF